MADSSDIFASTLPNIDSPYQLCIFRETTEHLNRRLKTFLMAAAALIGYVNQQVKASAKQCQEPLVDLEIGSVVARDLLLLEQAVSKSLKKAFEDFEQNLIDMVAKNFDIEEDRSVKLMTQVSASMIRDLSPTIDTRQSQVEYASFNDFLKNIPSKVVYDPDFQKLEKSTQFECELGKYIALSTSELPSQVHLEAMIQFPSQYSIKRKPQNTTLIGVNSSCASLTFLDPQARTMINLTLAQLGMEEKPALSISSSVGLHRDELFMFDIASNSILVISLTDKRETRDDGISFIRASRLTDRGIFKGFSKRLIPYGCKKNKYFELTCNPPALIGAISEEELEIHSIGFGSAIRLTQQTEAVVQSVNFQLTDDCWCVALLANTGRTTMIKGKEDCARESLVVEKTVFDTGLGAWDPEELEDSSDQLFFDCMSIEESKKRLLIMARKVEFYYKGEDGC